MRNALSATVAFGALAAILTACGGGGSGTTPASDPLMATAPAAPAQSVSGPTGAVTVSITIPHTSGTAPAPEARARMHALYGPKTTDAHIRTMANTAATSRVRTFGTQLNTWAVAYQKSTGRSPAYVSTGSDYIEFVVTSGSTVVLDQTGTCTLSTSTCSATFNVPVGSGYNATLYVYDNCDYLLSAGTIGNVTVTTGTNSPVTITLNPVVAYLDITATNGAALFGDPSQAQTFDVNVTPLDAEYYNDPQYNTETSPGVLVNESFVPITSVNLSLASAYSDVTPSAAQSLPVPTVSQASPTPYTFSATSYAYAGTGSESSVEWLATPVTTGSSLIPAAAHPSHDGTYIPGNGGQGSLTLPVTTAALSWTNPEEYPQLPNDPQFTSNGTGTHVTYWRLEFPRAANTGTYNFGISSNLPGYSGNVTISDNGECGGIVNNYFPTGTHPYASYAIVGVDITMEASAASDSCVISATDSANPVHTAYLYIDVDQSSLTIQQHGRSTK